MIIYIHTFKKVVYNNPWKIRKFGNRNIPSLFRIFRFTGQISLFSRNTPIKKEREQKQEYSY